MRLHRLLDGNGEAFRAELNGDLTRGSLFVGDDGVVRWIATREVLTFEGVGEYSGARGYPAYDADDSTVTAGL